MQILGSLGHVATSGRVLGGRQRGRVSTLGSNSNLILQWSSSPNVMHRCGRRAACTGVATQVLLRQKSAGCPKVMATAAGAGRCE